MGAMTIDLLLSLPKEEALELLCSAPETQWFDRKSGKIQAQKIAQHVCAFANSEGGLLAIGIQDKKIEPISSKAVNGFRRGIFDNLSPVPRHHIEHLELEDDCFVLLIEVPVSTDIHYTSDGESYIRVGDSTRKLSHSQLQELEFDRGARNYEDTLSKALLRDLDTALVETYAEQIGSPSARRALTARGMLTEGERVKVCGYLLFAEDPQQEFPSAYVRVLKYNDIVRGTGSTQNLVAGGDIRCEGSLTVQLARAVEAVEKLLPARRALSVDGTFVDIPMLPKQAWLEGIVNAIVHRSYSISGDHIRVEIFPNRVEIISPGRFPGVADPTNPTEINRYARNPRIARACADLNITQELGEGIRRIFDEMRQAGLVDPVYKQGSQNVVLTLFALDSIPERVRLELGAALKTLERMRAESRPLGTGEIIEITGLKRPTVLRHLRLLRDHGIVRWDGKTPNDPRATWMLQ